jgi:2-polyprenyl-3-methyl-5-hydroxy-6-metoxy-1,4-benzoquinol methylase
MPKYKINLTELLSGLTRSTHNEPQGLDLKDFLKEYKDKLIRFNVNEKYRNELYFLESLLMPISGKRVLDYGCGIGTAVEYFRTQGLQVYGYDRFNYSHIQPEWFVVETALKFDSVYFMHSIAHIDAVDYKLQNLKELLNDRAEIVVITPNESWLMEQDKSGYTPDPTVVSHFTSERLVDLFTRNGYKVTAHGQFGKVTNGYNERLFLKAKYEG